MKIHLTKEEKKGLAQFAKEQGQDVIEPLYDGFKEILKVFDEKNELGKDEKKLFEMFYLKGARTALDILNDRETLKKVANG